MHNQNPPLFCTGYKTWSLTLGEESRLRDLIKNKYVQYVQEYSCKWIKTLMNNNTEQQHAQYNEDVINVCKTASQQIYL